MVKKLFLLCLLPILCLSFSGCQNKEEGQTATMPPGITHAEGGIESTEPPIVTGRVVSVDDNKIVLKVQGVDWELLLNDQTKWEKQRFAELEMPVLKGSFMRIFYEEKDDKRTATKLEHLKVN